MEGIILVLATLACLAGGAIWMLSNVAVAGASVPSSPSSGPGTQATSIPQVRGAAPQTCEYIWKSMGSPNGGRGNNNLVGIAAIDSGNIWAVGYYLNGSTQNTLVEHWNCSVWAVVLSPNVGSQDNELLGVAAVAANDIWAVGYAIDTDNVKRSMTEHWNGSSWTVKDPNTSHLYENILYSVAAVAANDVFAVGYQKNTNFVKRTLIEHWNGSSWTLMTSANNTPLTNILYGIAVMARNNIWAVGTFTTKTLIEHWNGSGWSLVTSPNVGSGSNELDGVVTLGTGNVWAVGIYYTGPSHKTMTQHYSLVCVSTSPTSTSTPASTPTTCPLQFSDVPQGSTFYSYVRCMACRGIVNGYASGCETGNPCFRPNNNVTRGQLAKIVSNSAGLVGRQAASYFRTLFQVPRFTTMSRSWLMRGLSVGMHVGCRGAMCGATQPAILSSQQ